MSRYIDVAETAKLIRSALKNKFPGIKFSVKSSRYAGGASIHICYTDGPTTVDICRVTDPYAGAGFDGMIDMAYFKTSYLLADGTVVYGRSQGTEGSRGTVSAYDEPLPKGAEAVHFGADYVFVEREYSSSLLEREVVRFNETHGPSKAVLKENGYGPYVEIVPYDNSVQTWWSRHIQGCAE